MLVLFIASIAISGCVVLCNSCQSESNDFEPVSQQPRPLVDYIKTNYDAIFKADISVKSSTRSVVAKDDALCIYAQFPENTETKYVEKCADVRCINDMLVLQHETAAEFTQMPIAGCEIQISEEEYRKTYEPLLKKSKKYLKEQKGFTDEEIQEMVDSARVDELYLIPLVTIISADDNQNVLSKNTTKIFNPLSLFVTPTYASGFDWSGLVAKDYIECAAIAIGFDIAGFGFTSACKTWSKVAIKRAFIAIAAKAIGPVGAVLTVGSFVGCLYGRGK